MRSLRMLPAAVALALAIVVGCDDSTIPTGPDHSAHPVASIVIEPGTGDVALGESVQFTATPECSHGVALDRAVTWSVSEPELVSLDETGSVTGRALGDVTVTATAGGVDASASLAVTGAFIGEAGGIARSGDGNVEMEIPAGALAATTEVIILPAAANMLPDDPGYVAGTAYSCEPDGLQFRDQVRLRIRFDPAHVPEGYDALHLRLRHRERQRAQWEETNQNQLEAGENAFAGMIEHLSIYALVAMSGDASSSADVGVIRITVLGDREIVLDATTQLSAKVYDTANQPRSDWEVTWTSEDPSIAEVYSDGTVIARGVGSTRIVASYGGVTQGVTITVLAAPPDTGGPPDDGGGPPDGGHDEGYGNNLSWPVIFAEGFGVSGLPVTTDPGLRPTADEGIVVDALPFFYSGNVADYGAYYTQQSANTWQAEWLDASASGVQSATVYWGDNLTHHTWNTHTMIRVEHTLEGSGGLTGYNMALLYGTGASEMQGTDGTTGTFVPTLYSVVPRLTIQKLDAEGGNPVFTAFDGAVYESIGTDGPGGYGAEVNVGGKVVYGYNFMVRNLSMPANIEKFGWWRITFSLDATASVGGATVTRNVSLDALAASDAETTFVPAIDPATNRTWLDVYIESAQGGGSGGGGHSGG